MAQIFISHSKEDKDLVDFFSNAFAGTKVKAVFEEFERILTGKITSYKIKQDIENSNAVFVILSQNVHDIPHTRDWIVWETGVAKNKDIWVFEPYSQFGNISVIIPYLRHYVVFNDSEDWLSYLRMIVESYDDSHTLPTILLSGLAGAGVGAALAGKDRTGGAVLGGIIGGLVGLGISDKSGQRPMGLSIKCVNCQSIYNIHIQQGINFRCPVCNDFLKIEI